MGKRQRPDMWTHDTFLRALNGDVHEGRVTWSKWVRDFGGRCASPVVLECTARPEVDALGRLGSLPAAFLDMSVRCRRCPPCRRLRASVWRERATRELRYADATGRRAWFVTLTANPAIHHMWRLQAIKRFNDRGRDPSSPDFEGLEEADQRSCVEWQAYVEVNKYLKRLRKTAGAQFRYLLVSELHPGPGENQGQVHYHVLVTEVVGRLGERDFRKCWRGFGFAHAKLVKSLPGTVAAYATKVAGYISKEAGSRVRASRRYGEPLGVKAEAPGSRTVSDPSVTCRTSPSKAGALGPQNKAASALAPAAEED